MVRIAYWLLRFTFGIWRLLAVLLVIALCFTAPQLVVLVVVGALVYGVKKSWRPSGWAHGTARWADHLDMLHCGCFGSRELYVGTVAAPLKAERFKLLRQAPRWAADQVLRLFFSKGNLFVRISRGVHSLIVAPAGAGKSAGMVIPFLEECRESVVVVDMKGELYKTTAKARRAMEQRVVVLDPFHVVTKSPDSFSPLTLIDRNDPEAIDKLHSLATSMIPREPGEKEPHWTDNARMWLGAFMAFVIARYVSDDQNLQTVMQLLSSEKLRKEAIEEMKTLSQFDGMLARKAGQLESQIGEELGGVLSTLNRCTQYLNSPIARSSTIKSTFEAANLRQNITVYLVMPPQYQKSHAGLMRMWVEGLLQAVIRGGATEQNPVHFVLDEAASLGHMESIENALTQLRGYGARFQMYYQSLGQLKTCFAPGQDVTIRANFDTQVYFGLNDHATAEEVSKMLGQQTIVTTSASGGTSRSKNRDHLGQESTSTTSNDNWSAQETGRALLDPAEVLQLDARNAIVFSKGMPPLLTFLQQGYRTTGAVIPCKTCNM